MKWQSVFLLIILTLGYGFRRFSAKPKENGQFVAKQFSIHDQITNRFGCYLNNNDSCHDLLAAKSSINASAKTLKDKGWSCTDNDAYSKNITWVMICRRDRNSDDPDQRYQIQETYRYYRNKEECARSQILFRDSNAPHLDCDPNWKEWTVLGNYLRDIRLTDYHYKEWPPGIGTK